MTALVTGRIGRQVKIGADTFFERPCFGGRTRLRDAHGDKTDRPMVSAITALSLYLSNMVTLLLWLGVLISELPGVGTGGKPHNWVAPD